MSAKSLPDVEYLRQCFNYIPETGKLIWKTRPRSHFATEHSWRSWLSRFAGKEAGGLTRPGKKGLSNYGQVTLGNKKFLIHRIAFALYYGREPGPTIDHIDRNPSNNCINNLRELPTSSNIQNQISPNKNNKSGLRGVSWHSWSNKWRASIVLDRKQIYLGLFGDKDEAYAAYLAAKENYHKGAVIA